MGGCAGDCGGMIYIEEGEIVDFADEHRLGIGKKYEDRFTIKIITCFLRECLL